MNDITEQEMTRYFSNNLRLLRNGRTPPSLSNSWQTNSMWIGD